MTETRTSPKIVRKPQARAAVRGDQLSVAIIHRHGGRHGEDIVCLRLAAFVQWFGPVNEQEDGQNDG